MKKILLLLFLLLFPLLPVSAASSIIMNLDKEGVTPEYKEGESVEINYLYRNSFSKSENFKIFCGFEALDIEFPPMPEVIEKELLPSQSTKELSCSMKVYDTTPAGKYRGYVRVLDSQDKEVEIQERIFTVAGTDKMVSLNTLFCADENCNTPKSVFISGDDIFLKVIANLEDKDVSITMGDYQTKKEAVLEPNIVSDLGDNGQIIKIDNYKTGSYYVLVKVSGIGYKTTQTENDYAIIEQVAEIKNTSVCNLDGDCGEGETIRNCPQDCKISANLIEDDNEEEITRNDYTLLAFIVIILLIVSLAALVFYYLFIKNKKDAIM